jgi:hypothetical protein
MKRKLPPVSAWLAMLGLFVSLAMPARASYDVNDKLRVADLPSAAQMVVNQDLNNGMVIAVIMAMTEQKDGEKWYVVRMVDAGQPESRFDFKKQIDFDANGKVKLVIDMTPMETLPAAVKAGYEKHIPSGAKLERVKAKLENGETNYVIRVQAPLVFTLDANGELVQTLTRIPMSTLPEATQARIKSAFGKAKYSGNQVEVYVAKGKTKYAVDVVDGAIRSKLYFDESGNFVK